MSAKKNMIVKINWALVIGCMIIVFYLSSVTLQFPEIDKIDPNKYILHALTYGGLGFLCLRATYNWKKSFIISTLYGILMEINQIFIPFRSASFGDATANAIGSFLGSFVIYFVLTRFEYFKGWKFIIGEKS